MKGKIVAAACAVALMCSIPSLSAMADTGNDIGGWSEDQGVYATQAMQAESVTGAKSSPRHWGQTDWATFNGTTHKRAHGWTNWSGVYHYTTAQLEHHWPNSGVIASSGRQWGWNGTEAVSPWVGFRPNATSNGYGQARTYWGN